jgi:predicted nucleic-acid-binding Zn-ribbon protein
MDKKLECPLCKGTDFSREELAISGKWGVHQSFVVLVCAQCGVSQFFFEGWKVLWNVGNRGEIKQDYFNIDQYPTRKELEKEYSKRKK